MLNLDHKRGRQASILISQISQLSQAGQDVRDVSIPLAGGQSLVVHQALDRGSADGTKAAFLQEVRAMPALIHQSGLLQALAFCNAKAGARRLARLCLLHWLRHAADWSNTPPSLSIDSENQADQMYDQLLQKDPVGLRGDRAEAQALLVWLKQFAEVRFSQLLPDED